MNLLQNQKEETEPNKAVVPTPVAVTPPAFAGVAPSTSAALDVRQNRSTMPPIQYPRTEVLQVLRLLEELVVSLDRIGSHTHDKTPAERALVLENFIQTHDIFRKAAKARAILSEPFPTTLGADDMEELEREIQGINYWMAKEAENEKRA